MTEARSAADCAHRGRSVPCRAAGCVTTRARPARELELVPPNKPTGPVRARRRSMLTGPSGAWSGSRRTAAGPIVDSDSRGRELSSGEALSQERCCHCHLGGAVTGEVLSLSSGRCCHCHKRGAVTCHLGRRCHCHRGGAVTVPVPGEGGGDAAMSIRHVIVLQKLPTKNQ